MRKNIFVDFIKKFKKNIIILCKEIKVYLMVLFLILVYYKLIDLGNLKEKFKDSKYAYITNFLNDFKIIFWEKQGEFLDYFFRNSVKRWHKFHIVSPSSPWPFFISMNLLLTLLHFVPLMNRDYSSVLGFYLGLFSLSLTVIFGFFYEWKLSVLSFNEPWGEEEKRKINYSFLYSPFMLNFSFKQDNTNSLLCIVGDYKINVNECLPPTLIFDEKFPASCLVCIFLLVILLTTTIFIDDLKDSINDIYIKKDQKLKYVLYNEINDNTEKEEEEEKKELPDEEQQQKEKTQKEINDEHWKHIEELERKIQRNTDLLDIFLIFALYVTFIIFIDWLVGGL